MSKDDMEKKNAVSGGGGLKILEGVNFVVYTLVAIAIVVLANWFVDRHDTRWDLTPSKKYSLSPQTLKLVKSLDRDVSIYIFDQKQRLREGRDLLENYAKASSRVNLRYVDIDREPSLAKQFGVRTYGAVIVASGDKHYEAKSSEEEGVTNALLHVLRGQKTVYFAQGHGEKDVESSERSGYSRIKKQLESENYQVKSLTLLQKAGIPSDCSLLIIAGPKKDFLQQEVDAVGQYIKSGGRVLVMFDALADPRAENPANLVKLLSDWNVEVQNDLVIEPDIQIANAGPGMTVIQKYGSSLIVQPLAGVLTLFPFSESFKIGKDMKPGVTDDSLCETSADSYGVADFSPKVRDVSFRPSKDHKGPLTLAVSGTIAGGSEKKSEGRFVAVGTSEFVSNVYMTSQFGNLDLFMNAVNWLAAEEDMISIRPKPPEDQHLNVTQRQMNNILYFGVIGLPLLIIAAGTSVWWRRR
jgi:ABC-type uncharacterized transport system involved in gliding motility auxiliary subunit